MSIKNIDIILEDKYLVSLVKMGIHYAIKTKMIRSLKPEILNYIRELNNEIVKQEMIK